ncbi:MAG: hypothetical protein C0465_17760 [Ralstonia sp.]|uniref:plasmid mobilization protein n=1 Tax=Ralstonia sp. TaxID=54061 RepID=UPI00257F8E65|nr:plasmid mobilization relaxosome protein MobC [Ralstonia sp.]MBA4232447.1 hypothetical protein [Ralstonia sp.]
MTQPINTEDGKTKPSLGRPRTAKVKNHWISFRVTAEEHFTLLDKAERSGMSAGEYARSRVMRGIARAKATAKPDELFGDRTREVLHELRKQGVNLNQIAHHCNRHQIPPPPALAELITLLQALWRQVMR